MRILNFKFAFTLSEVLVTLGIIGVVSAMTVPTLMQNYQRKSYVTQLHKVYNEFSQAVMQYVNDKNALNIKEAGLVSDDAIDFWIKNYFRVVQDCGTDYSPCFADKYSSLNGTNLGAFADNDYLHYVLSNGSSVGIKARGTCILFEVDVNGQQGPNILGRDLFAVKIYPDGQLDDANPSVNVYSEVHPTPEEREEVFTKYCSVGINENHSWGCFGKILNDNWEMTY